MRPISPAPADISIQDRPGNADPDLNHPYHSGDLPNIVANATGAVTATSYTTRINLGGPLSPIDADGAAIIIHQNPDTNQTGTKGQGVGGGTADRVRRHRQVKVCRAEALRYRYSGIT